MKMKLLIGILMLLSLVSCSEILDRQREREQQENYVTPYKGKYIGTINGDMSGNLTLDISKGGTMEVKRETGGQQVMTYQSLLGGGSGVISSPTSFTEFTLIGSFETKSGTWKMGAQQGNWSVKKVE